MYNACTLWVITGIEMDDYEIYGVYENLETFRRESEERLKRDVTLRPDGDHVYIEYMLTVFGPKKVFCVARKTFLNQYRPEKEE